MFLFKFATWAIEPATDSTNYNIIFTKPFLSSAYPCLWKLTACAIGDRDVVLFLHLLHWHLQIQVRE